MTFLIDLTQKCVFEHQIPYFCCNSFENRSLLQLYLKSFQFNFYCWSKQDSLEDLHKFYYMQKQKSKSKLLLRAATLQPSLQESPQKEQSHEQQPVHQFILSQFKEKYDQLKAQFQAKKAEVDTLQLEKKKLEMLSHNIEYYQKEIKRLRAEVQKYQLQNEQNKHRFFVAENGKKDLEATSQVRQEQLKQTLKQLQKQKITVVELKYQLANSGKSFGSVLQDISKRNQEISQKYEQTTAALSKSEEQAKAAKVENEKLKQRCQQLQKILKEKDEQEKAFNEKWELNEYRSKHRIEDLEEQIKEISSKQNEKIKTLEAQVKQLESKRKSQELLLSQKIDIAQYAQQLRKKEQEVAQLQEKLREVIFHLNERNHQVHALQQKLKNVCSIDLLNQSQQKYADALNNHKVTVRALQNRIIVLQKQLQMTKLSQSSHSVLTHNSGRTDFQQLLKTQIQENSKLKHELSNKIDQVFALRNKLQQQQVRQSLLQNEIDILKKKQKAQQKNSKIGFEIQMQNLKNDVDSLRRKVEVTETKLAIKTKQVKDKDSFISSVIIGRSRQEDVPFVVAQLKRIFEAQYANKLLQANLKIQDLQGRVQGQ